MKYGNVIRCVLLGAILFGCTKDNGVQTPESTSKTPNFRLIGEDFSNIYQYSYNADLKSGELINLTSENNVALEYLSLTQVNELLTFYIFAAGSFSAIQRNTINGDNNLFDNFYTVSDDRSILWGTNSENKLFLGYFSPQSSRNYGVRIFDPPAGLEMDINISFDVNTVFQPLYKNGKLMLLYQDQQSNYKLTFMNTETSSLISTVDFGTAIPSIFFDENNDIAVILRRGTADQVLEVYDFSTLEMTDKSTFSLNRLFAAGFLEARFIDEKLYYINSYVQPSPRLAAPAVYDFRTAENTVIDMIQIALDVEQELQASIVLSAIEYNEAGDVFLVGYGKGTNAILEGGVLIISSEGKLLENINLSFAPTHIVE